MLVLSFEDTYRKLFAALHRYAFTIVQNEEWAIDIVQDAFLKYYHQLQQGIAINQERAYLYKIVYNTALTAKRKDTVEKSNINQAFVHVDTEATVEEKIINRERQLQFKKMVDEIVKELPQQCSVVFLKSRLEGKKYREIAAELNLSVKTVEAHMSKALKLIQEYLRVNGHKLSLIQIVMLYEIFG